MDRASWPDRGGRPSSHTSRRHLLAVTGSWLVGCETVTPRRVLPGSPGRSTREGGGRAVLRQLRTNTPLAACCLPTHLPIPPTHARQSTADAVASCQQAICTPRARPRPARHFHIPTGPSQLYVHIHLGISRRLRLPPYRPNTDYPSIPSTAGRCASAGSSGSSSPPPLLPF